MRQILSEKVSEIINFAKKNGKSIRYNIAMDILRDKNEDLTSDELAEIWGVLEKNDIHVIGEEDEDYQANEAEPDVFIPADVNIGQKPMNVYNLMERLENDEIDLFPGFQRHGDLWSVERQSRLIESMMLKIPIPAFYFDAGNDEKWVVIDGLQRLSAFKKYLVGNDKSRFEGLQYLSEFDGLTFDELPRQYMRRIKETTIVAYTVEKGTPDAVVYNIFQRINTGGLELNPQEIRQALYMGAATELIQELAESREFLSVTQYAISPERMADREYVTRFLAFTEIDYRKEYKGNIDNYLIKALKKVNNYDKDELNRVRNNFKRVMVYSEKIFGKYAFRKYNGKRRGPVNKALFEMWSLCFSELENEQLDNICEKKEEFIERFRVLQQSSEFINAVKAGDQYATVKRMELAHNFVRKFI